ncbi:MAG: hypothetical protein E7670_06665 [Ruminococcaceae bacterium]|nr:hypothetical protein [Oscillospiraceae bacterium]
MKSELKEKLKNLFSWKLFKILYAASLGLSFVWNLALTMYEGESDFFEVIGNSIVISLPLFVLSLIIVGIIGLIIMIVLKAGIMKILLSILMIVAGVAALFCLEDAWIVVFLIFFSFFLGFFFELFG